MAPTSTNDATARLTRAKQVNDLARTLTDELIWRDATGRLRHRAIGTACLDLPLETATPIREIPNYKDRVSYRGTYWFSQTGRSLRTESVAESRGLMLLDFQEDVVAITTQPFAIVRAGYRLPPKVPDYWVVYGNGVRAVGEVRPEGKIDVAAEEAFRESAMICERIGWEFSLTAEPTGAVLETVKLLAGFRFPRYAPSDAVVDAVLEFCRAPRRIVDVAHMLSPASTGQVTPAIYHLLWLGVLQLETLDAPLNWDTTVTVRGDVPRVDLP